MRKLKPLLLLIVVIAAGVVWQRHTPTSPDAPSPVGVSARQGTGTALPAFLPPQARITLDRIARRGPFEHRQDGSVFGNREHLLPNEPHGYYHEYTVETPGLNDRGARRIITGGDPPVVYYYTDDHYRSFRRFTVTR